MTFTDKYNLLKNERMFAVKCGPALDVFKTGLKAISFPEHARSQVKGGYDLSQPIEISVELLTNIRSRASVQVNYYKLIP